MGHCILYTRSHYIIGNATYCRLGFECEILLIVNCEFLHKTQSKESQEKEYIMNNVTHDHTPFACVLACDPKYAHAHVIDITHA